MADNTKHTQKVDDQPVEDQQAPIDVAPTVVAEEPVQPAEPEVAVQEPVGVAEPEEPSVKAETHSKKRKKTAPKLALPAQQSKWAKIAAITAGGLALLTLIASGVFSQYFKGRVLPNVTVAGLSSTAKKSQQLKDQLGTQQRQLKITIKTDGKTLTPKLEEIGYQIDIDKTTTNALNAKRKSGLLTKLAFWKHQQVPAVVTINDTLLSQYVETNTPDLSKAPQDSQLQFDANQSAFVITTQADGQGPDVTKLKQELTNLGKTLKPTTIKLGVTKKGPTITQEKLQPLLDPANRLVSRQVTLTGLGFSYKARPADIASWVTPTPQADNTVKLIIDSAKVQSYVDSISKKISSPAVDKKVIKDDTTGAEVVIQDGRNGTELADKQTLAVAIANALKNGQDATETMNITTADFKVVNLSAYDKWIEVDLSEQRTTAYERATPVKTFVVATGVRGHDTPVGEYSIWLKVRSQTMKGGSKASGDYYDIPNVEWVSYFYQDYALHGAWWRKVFGYPASHGCVNMTNDDAHWVFDWAPVGTKVIVHA